MNFPLNTWFDRALRLIVYLAPFTIFFFSRNFVYPFLTPKIYVFQALVELAGALWLALSITHKAYRPKLSLLTITLAVFLGILFIVSVFGLDPARSFWSTQDRGLGLVAIAHFALFYLILISLPDFNWKKYLTLNVGVAALASCGAIFQTVQPELFLQQSGARPGAFLGNPSFLASYLLFHLYIAGWMLLSRKEQGPTHERWGMAAALAVMAWALFLTETRAALLGLGAGLGSMILYAALAVHEPLYWPFRKRKQVAWTVLIAMVLVAGIFWSTRSASLWQEIPGIKRLATTTFSEDSDIGPRLLALHIAWESFKERPLLGFGFENFKYPFDKHYDPKLLRSGFSETFFDKPHNVFLEYLVSGGVVGILSYLALFAAAFMALRKPDLLGFRPFGVAALLTYMVQNAFLFDTFGAYLAFFILLAFINSPERRPQIQLGGGASSPALISSGVLVFLALVAAYSVNFNILYANYEQYWGLNYFLNRQPVAALDAYAKSLNTPNPYADFIRKDYATTVSQVFAQGVDLPDAKNTARDAMTQLALAINHKPNDYFLRTVFADSAMNFYPLDPAYLAQAEAQIAQAFKVSEKRQQTYYSAARLQVVKGRPDEALRLMKQAVDLDPQAADPHFYYGLTAFQAGDIELGIREVDMAKNLGREPKNGSEAKILANFYADAGRYEQAIEWYKAALAIDSGDLDTELKLGITYYYAGDRENARNFLGDVAKKADLTQSPVYRDLQLIFEDLGLSL